MKIPSFLRKLMPFGNREKLQIADKTQETMCILITEHPELWEAVKDVGYTIMNQKARQMVVVEAGMRDGLVRDICAIDDFLKICLTTCDKVRDNGEGHLPIMKEKVGKTGAGAKNRGEDDEKDAMYYIQSKDARDKNGKIKVSAQSFEK